jgi:hypothetical protein
VADQPPVPRRRFADIGLFLLGGFTLWVLGKILDSTWPLLSGWGAGFWPGIRNDIVATAASSYGGVTIVRAATSFVATLVMMLLGIVALGLAARRWGLYRREHLARHRGMAIALSAYTVIAVIYIANAMIETYTSMQALKLVASQHRQLEEILPLMTADEERDIRSRFAGLKNQAQLDAYNKFELDRYGKRYEELYKTQWPTPVILQQ